ncbi:hypothetical protein B484DRAFT_459401 [Ochromonadaceae sp. CCMP2298]|nr:hypothetical protein B484DRAFT_459401 [Ochromonadaceae sp. CCMP2298]
MGEGMGGIGMGEGGTGVGEGGMGVGGLGMGGTGAGGGLSLFVRKSNFLTTSRTVRLFGAGVKAPRPTDRVVYLAGAWDMLHAGHMAVLREARKLGDYVIVGVHRCHYNPFSFPTLILTLTAPYLIIRNLTPTSYPTLNPQPPISTFNSPSLHHTPIKPTLYTPKHLLNPPSIRQNTY